MATAAPGLTPEMVAAIDKLADFKVKNGEQFEALIRNKQRDNPTFAFLFDEASPGYAYYHRKVQEYTQAGLAALPAPGTMPPAPGTMPPYPNMAWAGTHQPTPMHAQFAPQQHPFAPQQQPYPVPPHPQPPQPFGMQPLPQPHLVAQHFAAQQHMMQQQQQQQACAMAAGFSPYGAPGFPPPLLPNPVPHGGAAATGPMVSHAPVCGARSRSLLTSSGLLDTRRTCPLHTTSRCETRSAAQTSGSPLEKREVRSVGWHPGFGPQAAAAVQPAFGRAVCAPRAARAAQGAAAAPARHTRAPRSNRALL